MYGKANRLSIAGIWMNYQDGHNLPILAVLCEGKHFFFCQFVRNQYPNSASPQVSSGKFSNGDRVVTMARPIELLSSIDSKVLARQSSPGL